MKQWQVVKHHIDGKSHPTLSLVDVENGKMIFLASISMEQDDDGFYPIAMNTTSGKEYAKCDDFVHCIYEVGVRFGYPYVTYESAMIGGS